VDALEYLEKRRGGPLTFYSMMRCFRECDEFSQVAYAKKLGISVAHLCDIEKGRKTVSPERAANFAHILGWPKEYFVTLALQDMLNKCHLKMKVHVEAA